VTSGATVDPDSGVAGYDHVPIHRHAFKTPSLRNVALTAPYMHNGVYRTLDQVVDFYDRGGGAGIGIELPNQTLSPVPLHLTRSEKRALVAFMRALTDTVVTAPASAAPRRPAGPPPTRRARARARSRAAPPRVEWHSARPGGYASGNARDPRSPPRAVAH
jgi:hypothetical protein